MTFALTIPSPRIPFTESNGIISREWFYFLQQILQILGSPSVITLPGTITILDNTAAVDGLQLDSALSLQTAQEVEDLKLRYQASEIAQNQYYDSIELATQFSGLKADISQRITDLELRQSQSDLVNALQQQIVELQAELVNLRYNDGEIRNRMEMLENLLGR